MRYAMTLFVVAGALIGSVAAAGQSTPPSAAADGVLATVRIPHAVLANGKLLPAGTYDLRLTNEWLSPMTERWVELVANGTVVAREVAVVLRDDDLPAIGASSVPGRIGTRVEMLKGGEYLRLSVKRAGERERYLVHLPVAPGQQAP
jgi:hypothetical protein